MEVYVPYHPDEPKSRLSDVLSVEERQELCRAMLEDVCRAIGDAGHSPVVLSTRELDEHSGDSVRVAPQDLTPAVNALLDDVTPPVGVLVGGALFVPITPAKASVPAAVITGFQGLVVFSQALVWIVLASAHAWLLDRTATAPAAATGGEYPDPATAD
jgi:hypothetical protein